MFLSFFLSETLPELCNLVPRALFPGFSRPAPKAREKRPGDEVVNYGLLGPKNIFVLSCLSSTGGGKVTVIILRH